jgi:hypothetical protein
VIDATTSMTASYDPAFTDEDTSDVELEDYLTFAADLQLDVEGARRDALVPMLRRAPNGGFGKVEAAYDVWVLRSRHACAPGGRAGERGRRGCGARRHAPHRARELS